MNRQLEGRPYTTWQLIYSYWQSEQRISAYLFLISVLLMTVLLVGIDVVLNYWHNAFYNALQEYDKKSVIDLMMIFLLIAGVFIIVQVYRYYLQSYLALRWRRWLTNQFLDRWLEHRSYYYLENFDETTDNPDQRIQEDIGMLVVNSLSLLIGLVNSIITIFSFIYILWTLSGVLKFSLGPLGQFHIHGYLAWVGFFYSLIGTYFTFKIGRPLIMLNFNQQRLEADFRYAAVDVRTHAEHIALYRGEHHQKTVLKRLVENFLNNWYLIILRQKLLLWFTAGYNQISVLVPLVVALPNYFFKVFKLGGLMQAVFAFRQVQDALSFLVNSYTQIAEWRAINKRLLTFINHVYEVETRTGTQNQFIYDYQDGNKILADHVSVKTPRGELLLENIQEEFVHGKNYLIQGMSGIGKSTFLRALAQIWPYGSGKIILPRGQKILYFSQKSYMPLGTLEEALLFPDQIHSVPEEELIRYMKWCDLQDLTHRLHETALWSQQLSPGEQQRVAFVRIFVHKPDWVILDESTSALDLQTEKDLYQALKKELPKCSIISIGHTPSMELFHETTINFEKYRVFSEQTT